MEKVFDVANSIQRMWSAQKELCFYPDVEMPSWYEKKHLILKNPECGFACCNNGLFVIVGGEKHGGKKWLHVSFSRKSRIPSYDDLLRVKKDFIGEDRKAVMVFPDKDHYVNLHPYCLHLYSCIDGDDGLPEFSEAFGTI